MENRVTPRFFARLNVEVHCEGKRLGRFLTRDMSLFGVFLETRSVVLPSDELLDLIITVNGRLGSKRRVDAIVVRREADGTGLRFVKDGHSQNINLNDILLAASQAKRSGASQRPGEVIRL